MPSSFRLEWHSLEGVFKTPPLVESFVTLYYVKTDIFSSFTWHASKTSSCTFSPGLLSLTSFQERVMKKDSGTCSCLLWMCNNTCYIAVVCYTAWKPEYWYIIYAYCCIQYKPIVILYSLQGEDQLDTRANFRRWVGAWYICCRCHWRDRC